MPWSRPRRLTLEITRVFGRSFMSRSPGCGADGRVNALVAAATAEIARHRVGDLLVGRRGLLLEQCRGLHDLAGLAVAALRHADIAPGHLHGMIAVRIEALDGDD